MQVEIANNLDLDELSVRIKDDGHGSLDASLGTGSGITGMRERSKIYAGTVDAGPAPQGGWAVEAVLHPGIGTP